MAKKCHRIAEKRRCKRMALGVSSHPRASSDVTVCCRALQTLKGKARFHHWLTLCPSHLHLSFVKPGLLCMAWFKSSKCQLNIQWNWNRRVTSSTNPRFEKSCGNAHASHSRMTMIIKKNSRNIISFSSKVWHLFKQYCVLISKTYSAFGPHYSQNFFHSRTTKKKKNCNQRNMNQEYQRSWDSVLGKNKKLQLGEGKAGRGYVPWVWCQGHTARDHVREPRAGAGTEWFCLHFLRWPHPGRRHYWLSRGLTL